MLATWLVEMNLSKLNSLEDGQLNPGSFVAAWPITLTRMISSNPVVAAMASSPDAESLQLERSMVEEELRGFLSDYIVRQPSLC